GLRGMGRRSLRFLHAYAVENSAPLVEQTDALVQIADWNLVFAQGDRKPTESALEEYERAYDELAGEGVAQQSIDEIFAPEVPVVLPAFLPNPLASEETPETSGFIDVEFDITKGGESDEIEILDTTTNASDEA